MYANTVIVKYIIYLFSTVRWHYLIETKLLTLFRLNMDSNIRSSVLITCSYFLTWLKFYMLRLCGDVEENPGQTSRPSRITIGLWNVNSILATGGSKIPFIESYQNQIQFDIFCVCESSLNNKNSLDDIHVDGFAKPFRCDAIRSNKHAQGGVLLYFKENLPILDRVDLNTPKLGECIISEIRCKNEKVFVVLAYRTPSQKLKNDIVSFTNSIQKIIDNINKEKPSCILVLGDLNARSPLIWSGESKEDMAGKMVSDLMNINGFEQQINEPTHLPSEDISTCIDVIYTNQPYLLTDCGVLPSLDPKCKHQLVYGKINFHIPCPPKYKRKIYNYSIADTGSIKNHMHDINWNLLFQNKTSDEMVSIFTESFQNLIEEYIPHKIVTCNDRDAPWITPNVKCAIIRNKRVYKKWIKDGKAANCFEHVKHVQKETESVIREAKKKHIDRISSKLCDPNSGQKEFWKAFRRVVNKKKTTNIPPLIENDIFVTNFKDKANIFNTFFAEQCRPLQSNVVLPPFCSKTNNIISNIHFSAVSISKILKQLNPKKSHGCDNISIRMLQICPEEVALPLKLIFEKSLLTGIFPSQWKLANIQPVHKKSSRQVKSNYRPISLLPVCSKVFEKIIFDNLYKFSWTATYCHHFSLVSDQAILQLTNFFL